MPGRAGRHPRPIAPAYRRDLIREERGAAVKFDEARGAGTSEPGLGLGLATHRRLVEGHHGRYGVSSRPGEGALFWFELPAAGAPPPHEIPPLPGLEPRSPAT